MVVKGTIFIPSFYTDKTSDPVDIGEFKWTLVGAYNKCPRNALESDQYCQLIRCQPKTDSRTILWSCAAVGTLATTNDSRDEQSVFHFWSTSFGNGFTDFHAHFDVSTYEKAAFDCKGRIFVEVVDSFIADLSQPNNPLITCSEDAVKLKIDGEELWVTKKNLALHTHFFNVLFTGDFKEKSEDCYELKDIKLEDFLMLLGIVHNLTMIIDENIVEGLLKLADFFRCKIVLDRCEEYIKNAPVKRLPLHKKLQLAEKFKLRSTLTDIIDKAPLDKLKQISWEGDFSAFARSLMFLKFRVIDP